MSLKKKVEKNDISTTPERWTMRAAPMAAKGCDWAYKQKQPAVKLKQTKKGAFPSDSL